MLEQSSRGLLNIAVNEIMGKSIRNWWKIVWFMFSFLKTLLSNRQVLIKRMNISLTRDFINCCWKIYHYNSIFHDNLKFSFGVELVTGTSLLYPSPFDACECSVVFCLYAVENEWHKLNTSQTREIPFQPFSRSPRRFL